MIVCPLLYLWYAYWGKILEFTAIILALKEEIQSKQHLTRLLLLVIKLTLDVIQSLKWGVYIVIQMQYTPYKLFSLI